MLRSNVKAGEIGPVNATKYDTPALMLDMDALERNIGRMADYFRGKKAKLRPHVKGHKSPFIAQMQIIAGAAGVTCATMKEAEVMVQSGINDVFIANEILDEEKIQMLAKLARYSSIKVAVDSERNAKQISNAASRRMSKIGILIDVNLGGQTGFEGILDRCGLPPGPSVATLANEVSRMKNLEFKGLMGYEGGLRKFPEYERRKAACERALTLLIETRDLVSDSGLSVDTVSCGGTRSYNIAGEFPGVTEVQAGSYVFMDETYRRFGLGFEIASTVSASVISNPKAHKVITDAGLKAISMDQGLPLVKDKPEWEVTDLNAEHGHIIVKRVDEVIDVGQTVELVPTHIDTTVCLHDSYLLVRDGKFEMRLGVAARGY
jgi:3-hydroxy-D-aspartate aldolase